MFYVAYILDTIRALAYDACSYFKPDVNKFRMSYFPGRINWLKKIGWLKDMISKLFFEGFNKNFIFQPLNVNWASCYTIR